MPTVYDAVVVGSGAAGLMAATELCLKGLKVQLLEAGPPLDQRMGFHHHAKPYEFPFRGRIRPLERAKYNYSANEWNKPHFINELDHPYTGKKYVWVRARCMGGKTLHWGLVSLRFSPRDFKAATHDGYGVDWPIAYEDVEPYYTRVEQMVGVAGNADHLENNPDSHFLKPVPLTCPEVIFHNAVERQFPDRPVIHGRTATATEPINGRAPCHYCGHCGRVCNVGASFSSTAVLLPIAQKTGNLTVRPNAVAWQVLSDAEGRARSVLFVDRESRQTEEAFGKVIVLGASSLESTRILLNSKSAAYPNGLANSSGALGHYFCEQIMAGNITGIIPQLRGRRSFADDARPDGTGIYIPRFRNLKDKSPNFIRGYGFEGGGGSEEFPGFALKVPGYGAKFKDEVKKNYATVIGIGSFGEILPRNENYIEIDPVVRDAWGIPVLKFNIEWGPNELAMAKDMVETQREMMHAAGAEILDERTEPLPPGWSIHEAGTARMGQDPKSSVLDQWNQTHDVKNLFVVDAASFVNSTEKNPTLTIMALAMRACDHIADEMQRGAFA
ncbi:MAG TPA: GMC family oxidoreductase [Terriglobia bacterium]|jgi:choline dehydrogenase-like flavoprotein|nr:GMC family oxidoreductase [Terriglobia bacterium]